MEKMAPAVGREAGARTGSGRRTCLTNTGRRSWGPPAPPKGTRRPAARLPAPQPDRRDSEGRCRASVRTGGGLVGRRPARLLDHTTQRTRSTKRRAAGRLSSDRASDAPKRHRRSPSASRSAGWKRYWERSAIMATQRLAGAQLGYLLHGAGFFHQAHRAVDDCHALLEILDVVLPTTGAPALAALLQTARKATTRVWAEQSPFELKDTLKRRREAEVLIHRYRRCRDRRRDRLRSDRDLSLGCRAAAAAAHGV